MFTLIHQNLLVLIGRIGKNQSLKDIEKPNNFQNLQDILEKHAQFVNLNIVKDKLNATYNRSLVHHSCYFKLFFDNNEKRIFLNLVAVRKGKYDENNINEKLIQLIQEDQGIKLQRDNSKNGVIDMTYEILPNIDLDFFDNFIEETIEHLM